MSDAFEATIELNDPRIKAKLVVKADTVQELHDRLTASVDAASFSLIGVAVSAVRTEAEAQGLIGAQLDARPADAPLTSKPEPEPQPENPADNPWNTEQSAPNLPKPDAPPAPQASTDGPPLPAWAR